jgi:hypothetical protein
MFWVYPQVNERLIAKTLTIIAGFDGRQGVEESYEEIYEE